jgi:hypothetical protein
MQRFIIPLSGMMETHPLGQIPIAMLGADLVGVLQLLLLCNRASHDQVYSLLFQSSYFLQ